jgi:acyl-coenzyme A synthetase/AMP-(fatty) acid ligase
MRINDLGATPLIVADGSYRRGMIIRLKDVADKALRMASTVGSIAIVEGRTLRMLTSSNAMAELSLINPRRRVYHL